MFFCVGGSAVDVAGAKLKCEQLRASDDGESLSHWHARHEDQSEWCVTNLFVRCKWKREVSVKKIKSYISNRREGVHVQCSVCVLEVIEILLANSQP